MTNNRIPTQMTEQISGLFRTFQHYKIPENHDLPYYHLWHSRSFLIATHDAVSVTWNIFADFLSSTQVFQLFLSLHQINTPYSILKLMGNYITDLVFQDHIKNCRTFSCFFQHQCLISGLLMAWKCKHVFQNLTRLFRTRGNPAIIQTQIIQAHDGDHS